MQSHLSQQQKTALQEKLIGKTSESVLHELYDHGTEYDSSTGEGFIAGIENLFPWVKITTSDILGLVKVSNSISSDDGSIITILKKSVLEQVNNDAIKNEEEGRAAIAVLIKTLLDVIKVEVVAINKTFEQDIATILSTEEAILSGLATSSETWKYDLNRDNLKLKAVVPLILQLPAKYEQALIQAKLLSAPLAKDNKHDPAPASKSAAASPAATGATEKGPNAQQKQQPAKEKVSAAAGTAVPSVTPATMSQASHSASSSSSSKDSSVQQKQQPAKINFVGYKENAEYERLLMKNIRDEHESKGGFLMPEFKDVNEKFEKLAKDPLPINADYLNKIKSKLELLWKRESTQILGRHLLFPESTRDKFNKGLHEPLNKDFHQLSNLVAEALTIRVSYNAKKKLSLNKGAMPFMGADVKTGQFPDYKQPQTDRNVNYIKEIEWKALNCLLDSSRTPIEAYNDLLRTLNSVSARAQEEFTLAKGIGLRGAYRMFRAWAGDKSDLTTVIDESIKANEFQPIPAANALQPKNKS